MNLRDFGQPWIPRGERSWIVDAHRGDGRRFVVHADELLTAFVELEREVLTTTFYRDSMQAESHQGTGREM